MVADYYRQPEDASSVNPPMMADYDAPQGGVTNFQPSLAVVLGVLAVMFSFTFALLLCAKCCQRDATTTHQRNRHRQRSSIFSSPANVVSDGLPKKAIDSLPFFRFGTLRGSKDGLECAVCLSKYDDAEILRLLPKCRHAFHINCVDQWLAVHSTCPLCRSNVTADDAALLSTSSRFAPEDPSLSSVNLNPNSSANEGVELFVEREEDEGGEQDAAVRRSSSIFNIGSSFRKLFAGSGAAKAVHKHNHKIVVSDVVFKNRWSSVSSSDLMFLKSEMMLCSDRFSISGGSNGDLSAAAARSLGDGEIVQSIKEEMDRKRRLESRSIETLKRDSPVDGRRSMSEITMFSRFRELGWRNYKGREFPVTGAGGEAAVEDKKRKIWLPIARKTVEWFAKREETQICQSSNDLQRLDFV